MATTASTPMMAMTIISSTSVKPASLLRILRIIALPVGILFAVQGRALRFAVDVEHALPAIGVRRGIILHRPQTPLRLSGHGIDGNAAQKLDFLSLDINTLDQRFQVRRI